jgi:palmitoyltransferase
MWWLGSKRENWEAVMGRNIWWWFREPRLQHLTLSLDRLFMLLLVPIGHSLSDGETYPVNPRFDSEGRWRRRAEWPSGLR